MNAINRGENCNKLLRWLWPFIGRKLPQTEPIPAPIKTHGCASFWYSHGCPDKVGVEIPVTMTSGQIAIFRLSKIERAVGVDWSWYDFDFVRYLDNQKIA